MQLHYFGDTNIFVHHLRIYRGKVHRPLAANGNFPSLNPPKQTKESE